MTPTQQRILREIASNRAIAQTIHGASCGTGKRLDYARLDVIQARNKVLKAQWDAEARRIEGEKP